MTNRFLQHFKCGYRILLFSQLGHICASYGTFSNCQPTEVLGFWFSECQQKRNIGIGHYEKIEKMVAIL